MKYFKSLTTLFCLLLISCFCVSAEQEGLSGSEKNSKAHPRVGYLSQERLQQRLLADSYQPKELVWLDVTYPPVADSGEQPQPRKVLALKQPSHLAEQQGAVLILHDKELHADWPELIRPLRMTLPESGWFTLSVNMPYVKQALADQPKRTLPAKLYGEVIVSDQLRRRLLVKETNTKSSGDGEKGNSETDGAKDSAEQSSAESTVTEDGLSPEDATTPKADDEGVDIDLADPDYIDSKVPYEDRAIAHVEAGVNYLKQEGYQNIIIIAHRAAANTLLRYIEKTQGNYSSKGFAMIMIDPRLNEEFQADMAKALGDNFPAPVLDLIGVSSADEQRKAKQRKVSAVVSGASRYEQIKMPTVNNSIGRSVPRRIRSWLDKAAPGMVMNGRR